MKTYLLKYLKPNTHTFYDIVKSKDQIEAEERMAKEPDLEKRKLIITPDMMKRFIELQQDIRFFPGINEVSEEHYNLLKAHPFWAHHFDDRPPSMEWVPGFGPDDEKMKTFSQLKDNEALNIVEAMWTKPLIEKYLAGEKREKIKAALEKQLDKLKIPERKAA